MADYWISQTRKYCDFCKCWITDNKPSVDFHEKGRRHQANVQRKLNSIHKISAQTQKDTENYDATLKQMESAAMHAYRKDVENNADLTSVAINKRLQDDNLAINEATFSGGGVTKLWNEARDKNGKLNYINIMTNETKYTAPSEGYLSLKEQREQADVEAHKQLQALDKFKRKEAIVKMQHTKKEEMEEKARLAREKLKERRVVDDITPVVSAPLIEPGKNDAYGKWQTIQEKPYVDLQLPEQEAYFEIPVELEPEPYVKEFKEKTVESLGESSGVTFKKRKFGGGAKRNTRQRLDDD